MSSSMFPYLSVNVAALDANISLMKEWCTVHDVNLAPHVKTTMCRPIVERQIAAGAGAVTVATVSQAETVLTWGCNDVVIANEVIDIGDLSDIRKQLDRNPTTRIRCFVDSDEGIEIAQHVFGPSGPRLEVLVDIGAPGGRTGVRTAKAALRLCETAARSAGIRLVGVAGFEGIVPNSRDRATLNSVDSHCARTRDTFLEASSLFETDEPVFSMGGSAYPDRAVAQMPTSADLKGTVRLLRSGCYVTHDHGTYARASPIDGLEAALAVHAVVLSTPEPGLAILGAGRRNLPYDSGLPVLIAARTSSGVPIESAAGQVRTLYDHHAVLESTVHLAVSDVVELGISHPCSAFDRWSRVVAVNGEGRPLDYWPTSFDRH